MFKKATNEQLRAIYQGGDCPAHLFSGLVKETMSREVFINYNMFCKASDEQLWVIVKHDKYCDTPLLIGVVHELIRRDELKKFIFRVIISVYKSISAAEEFTLFTVDDLVQIGYEGVIEALQEYKQGHGTYANFLYFVLINKYKELSRDLLTDKRKSILHTYYYQQSLNPHSDETFELFLADQRMSVEKEVIQKIMFGDKIKLLGPKQKYIFQAYLKGYTLKEIGIELNLDKTTIQKHLAKAMQKMAGQKINLWEIGAFERASYKKAKEVSA